MADQITRAADPVVNGQVIQDTIFNGEVDNLVAAHNALALDVTQNESDIAANTVLANGVVDDIALVGATAQNTIGGVGLGVSQTGDITGADLTLTGDIAAEGDITCEGSITFDSDDEQVVLSGNTGFGSRTLPEPWGNTDGLQFFGMRVSYGQIVDSVWRPVPTAGSQTLSVGVAYLRRRFIYFAQDGSYYYRTVNLPSATEVPDGVEVTIINENLITHDINCEGVSVSPSTAVSFVCIRDVGWFPIST